MSERGLTPLRRKGIGPNNSAFLRKVRVAGQHPAAQTGEGGMNTFNDAATRLSRRHTQFSNVELMQFTLNKVTPTAIARMTASAANPSAKRPPILILKLKPLIGNFTGRFLP